MWVWRCYNNQNSDFVTNANFVWRHHEFFESDLRLVSFLPGIMYDTCRLFSTLRVFGVFVNNIVGKTTGFDEHLELSKDTTKINFFFFSPFFCCLSISWIPLFFGRFVLNLNTVRFNSKNLCNSECNLDYVCFSWIFSALIDLRDFDNANILSLLAAVVRHPDSPINTIAKSE